ncbi:protein kinase [Acidianus sp. RZ1]|uniref:protein kinase domain-containing protein n=1 Tax=Acidianus sp. RZ1 TaxID=1540082 RepID=UPI001490AFA2|nr:protein kinase [Acidianus sp. RZ1]NON61556.1 protein kinase [Acidianus sp. RZ1]
MNADIPRKFGIIIRSLSGILAVILGYFLLHSYFFPSLNITESNFLNFIEIESLFAYALVFCISPSLKAFGISTLIAIDVVPFLIFPFSSNFNSIIGLSTPSISLVFYIVYLASFSVFFLIFFTHTNIKSKIASGIISALFLMPLLNYSIINIQSFSSIPLPYISLISNLSNPINEYGLFASIMGIVGFITLSSRTRKTELFLPFKNVSLPFFLVSLIPLEYSLLIGFHSISPLFISDVNGFSFKNISINFNPVFYLEISSFIVLLTGYFLRSSKKDLSYASQFGILISSISFLTAILILFQNFILVTKFLSIPVAFLFLSLSSVTSPRGIISARMLEKKLYDTVKEGTFREATLYVRSLSQLGYTPTRIFCDSLDEHRCDVSLWLSSKYKIDFGFCKNLSVIADCIISSSQFPTTVLEILDILASRDKESAKRLASFIISKNPNKIIRENAETRLIQLLDTKNVAKEETVNLPRMNDWKPDIWISKQLYGYNITKVLGIGGTSYVLQGERENKKFAIKIPKISSSTNDSTRTSFSTFEDLSKESSRLQDISDKSVNMVKLFGMFIDVNNIKSITNGNTQLYYSSPPAIVMELMEGGTAEELLNQQNIFLSDKWKNIVTLIALQISQALEVLHAEGYVHLDVKPRNIFFSNFPGKFGDEVYRNLVSGKVIVKLGDLGSSRKIGERFLEYTPEYCSIEQVEAMLVGKGANPKMDVYALGASIYKLLEGRTFNPSEIVSYMDKAVENFLKGSPFKVYLESARLRYLSYYNSLQVKGNLELLIKELTDPSPEKRPDMATVVQRLKSLASLNP